MLNVFLLTVLFILDCQKPCKNVKKFQVFGINILAIK